MTVEIILKCRLLDDNEFTYSLESLVPGFAKPKVIHHTNNA